jgi:hypothetical protein
VRGPLTNGTAITLLVALSAAVACSGDPAEPQGSEGAGAAGALSAGGTSSAGSGGAPTAAGGAASGGGGSFGAAGGSLGGTGAAGASAGTGGLAAGAGGTLGGGGASAGSGGTAPEEPPAAPEGSIPNDPQPPSKVGIPKDKWADGLISPTLESEHHNQPAVINGYLQLTGNARFSLYDISNPAAPVQLSENVSPRDCKPCGEAEGHQVSFAKYGKTFYTVTIQGKGVDLWDITDARAPKHLKSVDIQGINFGDFTEAVWGVAWQGRYIYVGGTNTGLHVIDASDPPNAQLVARLANVGGVLAGPLFPIGNLLIVTTPKNNAGVATVDISDPLKPLILDSVLPGGESYIGAFYGRHAYLLNPIRVYDVLTDPTDIKLISSGTVGGYFEYMSFQDGFMFAGRIRPEPGATKINVTNPAKHTFVRDIYGRRNLKENDDQFTVAIGNLLVMSDDQLSPETNKYAGTVIGVHDTAPDTTPPRVEAIVPKNGATGQPVTTRIGISFTDNIELATVDTRSFIVRPVGGEPLKGTFGVNMSVLHFQPDEPLKPGTTYEVVLPAGGIKDYVGNGIAEEFVSTFTTK